MQFRQEFAAFYGSVSAVTSTAAMAFMEKEGTPARVSFPPFWLYWKSRELSLHLCFRN
jgi:hypothetical protein